ncbi:MAG TPA: DUF58 domain-containing protein [Pseudonocardia sp.]|nr:DUF58 domain-containing protein [Pseudonocardia sp.]
MVCALVLDERDLLRVGAFATLLPLLALLLMARTRRAVRAGRTVLPARLPVDGTAGVELRLSGGTLLGGLRLVDEVPDAAGPDAEAPPRFLVSRVPRRDGLRLSYSLQPSLRGVHRIGPLVVRATDPLGLAELSHELAGADRMVVLPRVVALQGLPAVLGRGAEAAGAAPARQGTGLADVLVRPYQQGDELRQEERPWRGGTTVLLDRRDAAHRGRGPGASLEFAISLVASIGMHLIGRGAPVTLVTEDGTELTGPGGANGLLDALAAVRPAAQHELTGPASGTGLIAVLGALAPGELGALLGRGSGGHAVLLDVATWTGAAQNCPPAGRTSTAELAAQAATLRRAGWQVTTAAAGVDPATVWTELIRQDRAVGVW